MKVRDMMTTQVAYISPQATTKEAARMMHDLHIGSLPVMDDGRLVGILTDRDICCLVIVTGHDAVMTKVHEVMKKKVDVCFIDDDIADAADNMTAHRIRRLVVLDRDNHLSGFLSVDDLARTSHNLASSVLESTALNYKVTKSGYVA